jgi:uncharacterized membrane protein YqjE
MTEAVFVPSKRVNETILNVAVIAALVAGLVGWWVTLWPARQSQLTLHAGQIVSHSFKQRQSRYPRDYLIVRTQSGSDISAFVESRLVPNLETLSGQAGSVSIDAWGQVYRLEVNGVERLAFEKARTLQLAHAVGVLFFYGPFSVMVVLMIGFRLWKDIQASEPSGGAG